MKNVKWFFPYFFISVLLIISAVLGVDFIIKGDEYAVRINSKSVGLAQDFAAANDAKENHIKGELTADQGYVKLVEVEIPVKKGDVIEVHITSSAKGEFYFRLIGTQGLTTIKKYPLGVTQTGSVWGSISTTGLFVAQESGVEKYVLEVSKSDVSGVYNLYRPTLIAKIVARKSLINRIF